MQSAFIVYANVLFARGLARLLEEEGVKVVGSAMQNQHALGRIKKAAPDVIITEIESNTPKSGIFLGRLLRELPSTAVLWLTLDDNSATLYTGHRCRANTAADLVKEIVIRSATNELRPQTPSSH